jgi:hypothetical protein
MGGFDNDIETHDTRLVPIPLRARCARGGQSMRFRSRSLDSSLLQCRRPRATRLLDRRGSLVPHSYWITMLRCGHSRLRLPMALAVMAVVVGCRAPPSSPCVDVTEQAIYGASNVPIHQQGASASVMGIIIIANAGNSPRQRRCTGVTVAPRLVLTAAHCFKGASDWDVTMYSAKALEGSITCVPEEALIRGQSFVVHHSLDLAAVRLRSDRTMVMPIFEGTLLPGSDAYIAGYGLAEANQGGRLQMVPTKVATVSETLLTTDSGPGGGACVGDSGGPLLVETGERGWSVAGCLSQGSASCTGEDQFVRLDGVMQWVSEIEASVAGAR